MVSESCNACVRCGRVEIQRPDKLSIFGYPPSDVYDGLRLRTLTLFPSSQNFGIIRHGRT
ncbi:hypothetical protein [Nostoc sp. FACHB-133]|uniref:hypothetical protein n=1 Tax=Nostoc sp. FACHB-133 TaxID=2692835 RepID=UPI001686C12C|nr:hypothetical protein [Nostoc sp. FACHB-133]MBD2525916.1 hypothetical protein [Nostoc sp. FACHB-133]